MDPVLVLRKVVGSVHLAAYSYIKPGAMHRYSSGPQPYNYVHIALSLSNEVYRLAVDVDRACRGEIGLPDIRLGQTLSRSLREGLVSLGVLAPLDMVLSIIFSALALSHGYSRKEQKPSGYLKALYDVLSATTIRDTLEFYDTLRRMGYSEVEYLELQGYTRGYIEVEGYRLIDIIRPLSSKHKLFNYVQPHNRFIVDVAETIIEDYEAGKDLNNAVVRGYIELLRREENSLAERLEEALRLKLTRTRDGLRLLYNLDQELRKSGRSFDGLIPVLVLTVSIASPQLPI